MALAGPPEFGKKTGCIATDRGPTMAGNAAQDKLDAADHTRTYKAIMKWSTEHGVPGAMALTAFFSFLVMRAGVGAAVAAFVVVYVVVHVIARTFFSSH